MATDRLFRLSERKDTLILLPAAPPAEAWRCHSPVVGSTLITSAPRSPRRCAANGPAIAIEQSRTRYPESTPRFDSVMLFPCLRDVSATDSANNLWWTIQHTGVRGLEAGGSVGLTADGADGVACRPGRLGTVEDADRGSVLAALPVLEP